MFVLQQRHLYSAVELFRVEPQSLTTTGGLRDDVGLEATFSTKLARKSCTMSALLIRVIEVTQKEGIITYERSSEVR